MKRISRIFMAAALVLIAASCSRKLEYEFTPYVTLNNNAYSFNENMGEVAIPVALYNSNGSEVQVTVTAVDGSAKNGKDFEIVSPSSGILTFNGDVTEQEIKIRITNYEGEFTGSTSFEIKLASTTDNVPTGNLNTAFVTINDLDHPLNQWIGTWKGVSPAGMFGNWPGGELTLQIETDPNDMTFRNLIIKGGQLNPYFVAAIGLKTDFTAVVNEDLVTAVIAAGQPTGYEGVVIMGLDENMEYIGYDIPMILDGDALSLPNAWGANVAGTGSFYEIYFPMTFQRQ